MNMNKKVVGIIILLFVLSIAAGCGTASPGTPTSPKQIFESVITLEFLSDLGILQNPIDPIEGFTRFLLLIVLFTLLFIGADRLKLGRGPAIAISLSISLLTTIFIPGTVLLAIGTSYGTLFSLVLFSVPLVLGGLGYVLLKEHPWIKALLMGGLWFILTQMWRYLQTWRGASTSVYATVVDSVVGWIGWVVWIAGILFIINLIQALASLASGHAGGDMDFGQAAKWAFNKAKTYKARTKTAMLNEYIEEQKTTGLLEKATAAAQAALSGVNAAQKKSEFEDADEKEITNALGGLKKALDHAVREYKKVNRTTWRQERRMGKVIETVRQAGGDVARVTALENDILKAHNKCIKELGDVIAHFSALDAPVKALGKAGKPSPISAVRSYLDAIAKNVMDEIYELKEVHAQQVEIDKQVQGIISMVHHAV